MLNFNNQPGTLSAEKSGGAIAQSASFLKRLLLVTLFCALSFMLSAPSLVQAEDLQEGTPAEQPSTNVQPVNTADPAGLITSAAPENQAPAKANTPADDGLEIGPEIIGQPVGAGIEAPTITKAFIGTNAISGGNLHRGKINGKNARGTVHVTLKDSGGNEKATVSVTPKSGTTWKVDLPEGVTIAEGDTVTAYQEFDGQNSPVTAANAMDSLAKQNKDKLKMPTGEIWIEQTSSNQVNKDEQAEAVEMFNNANTAIAGDIKSVKFSIDTAEHAYYEVTYTDGSTSGKVEAPNLKIKQVTETSAAPTIEKVQVADGQIIVTLAEEVAAGTKFYFIKQFTDNEDKTFSQISQNGKNCTVDKSTSNMREMSQVSVKGKKVTFPVKDDDLQLGITFGIIVKEPHKFRSCAKSEPVVTTPDKVAVRDPHKLTDADKKAIENAIRNANKTASGVSKLPDKLQGMPYPAIIEFDKDGNVTIISPDDVEVTWDSNYNPVLVKNADGTYKVKDGVKVTKFPAKDLVKNIAPKSPAIAVDTDKGEVTITPPAYENPGDDTDLASYTITYKDASGAEKTVTVKRTVDGDGKTTWSSDDTTVDAKTGVVTLKVEDIEVGGTITATATDNGGLEGDTNPLTSDPASKDLETATVSYDRNGGTGDMDSKKLNKGAKYKILKNAFTAPENKKFKGWKIGDEEKAVGDEITVKDNTTITAIWEKIPVNVTYDANGGKGTMEGKSLFKGDTYKVLDSTFTAPDENQMFDTWEIDGKRVEPGTEITVTKDTAVKALWKKIPVNVTYDGNGGKGTMEGKTLGKGDTYKVLDSTFTAPDENQMFDTWEIDGKRVEPGTEITVTKDTAVKALWKKIPVTVTYDGNGGEGTMEGKTLDKGGTYKLLASTFTAPKNKEFKAWEIDGKEVAPDTEITVNKDTKVKAVWKDIMVDVSFEPGEGSGTMNKKSVKKGSTFKLPSSTFKAPKNKELKGWKIGEKEYQVGDEITVSGNTTVTAIWKNKPVPPSTTPGKDKPGKQGKSQPQNPAAGGNLSKTGANGMYSLYTSMIMLAAGSLFVISRRRRAQR